MAGPAAPRFHSTASWARIRQRPPVVTYSVAPRAPSRSADRVPVEAGPTVKPRVGIPATPRGPRKDACHGHTI